jgi:hypothetical protein
MRIDTINFRKMLKDFKCTHAQVCKVIFLAHLSLLRCDIVMGLHPASVRPLYVHTLKTTSPLRPLDAI